MPIFTNNPANKVEALDSFEKGANWNSCQVTLFTHNGTHLDAPRHFDDKGKAVTDLMPEQLVYQRPYLLELDKKADAPIHSEDLAPALEKCPACDLLMIRTGFWKERGKRAYVEDNPWLAPDAARLIRTAFKKLRALAIDTISIASFKQLAPGKEAHQILLIKNQYDSEPVLIIEDVDLGRLPPSYQRVLAIPLFVKGADSMPCTVLVEALS